MAIFRKIPSFLSKIAIFPLTAVINFYRYCISPFIPARCRYYPTCSEYALEALKTHGILKGLNLSICRLLRCHPLSKREYFDPVPRKQKGLKHNES